MLMSNPVIYAYIAWYVYRLTHGSWGVTGYTRSGQLYNTQGSKVRGCYKLTTEGMPVTPQEPWVNLFVAQAKRRIPLALTGCVLTCAAWERTGAASGAVASHLNSKWTTATWKNLPQRRPRRALPLQCHPVKWTRFARVMFHRIPRKPHPGQCMHLRSGELSGTRKANLQPVVTFWVFQLATSWKRYVLPRISWIIWIPPRISWKIWIPPRMPWVLQDIMSIHFLWCSGRPGYKSIYRVIYICI